MKRILFIMLMFMGLNAYAQKQMYVQSGNGLNLRTAPSTSSEVITSIPYSEKVHVISRTNDEWVEVKYKGNTGYISSKYIDENKPKKQNNNSSKSNKNNAKGNKSNNNSNSSRSSGNNSSNKNGSSGGSSSRSNSPGYANEYDWGIGLRLGDPFGLSVKKYLARGRAFEINLGSTHSWGYSDQSQFYKRDRFYRQDYEYRGSEPTSSVSLQGHYLFSTQLGDVQGLRLYYGFGAQFRFLTREYRFRERIYTNGRDRWVDARDRITRVEFGLDGVVGLEYTLPTAPVSFFTEFDMMIQFVAPSRVIPQFGIGARFNF
ncbi:SH3 domain-containing protein [Persicobacter diffluens]